MSENSQSTGPMLSGARAKALSPRHSTPGIAATCGERAPCRPPAPSHRAAPAPTSSRQARAPRSRQRSPHWGHRQPTRAFPARVGAVRRAVRSSTKATSPLAKGELTLAAASSRSGASSVHEPSGAAGAAAGRPPAWPNVRQALLDQRRAPMVQMGAYIAQLRWIARNACAALPIGRRQLAQSCQTLPPRLLQPAGRRKRSTGRAAMSLKAPPCRSSSPSCSANPSAAGEGGFGRDHAVVQSIVTGWGHRIVRKARSHATSRFEDQIEQGGHHDQQTADDDGDRDRRTP